MSEARKGRGLGRGLSALMADVRTEEPVAAGAGEATPRRPDMMVPVERVQPNPDQPRRTFTPDQLDELAESIRVRGIIQPLIVREKDGNYEIVAGERRWRAAQIAQLHEVPVLVRDFNDTEVLEVAIIENIQRADLNPVEEAAGYRALMDRFGHTQEKVAEALGKSRSYIANLLRLLNLPDEILNYLKEGQLSAGHARALITAENPVALARQVIQRGLSVRETERLVKLGQEQKPKAEKKPRSLEKDADTRALEGDLSATIGMKVSIDHTQGQKSGKVVISYDSLEKLDELCSLLSSGR
ncbi:ParB/RepB/Spo0J family partition protein [Pseudooceanicola nanhaiensis]|uniref:ParB/RepB/Spo0J family partition protein n=1 Tax=Pseudooceanicola nanhaiensis TaxID=375761 RepID=UPI001CD25E27|nr:ParB/RepB/Spo0J family partition protein [Pseudooceanicola nanhaiensis]MCA0920277.1 ParB/RepB/Spo0J family partition protein [Pseudooceanicola nanhaiensis]